MYLYNRVMDTLLRSNNKLTAREIIFSFCTCTVEVRIGTISESVKNRGRLFSLGELRI